MVRDPSVYNGSRADLDRFKPNSGPIQANHRKSIMADWAQQVVNAATIGGMYTLVAVGFTLFFGVLGLINFAHGEVFMLGAFVALFAAHFLQGLGVPAGWLLVEACFSYRASAAVLSAF